MPDPTVPDPPVTQLPCLLGWPCCLILGTLAEIDQTQKRRKRRLLSSVDHFATRINLLAGQWLLMQRRSFHCQCEDSSNQKKQAADLNVERIESQNVLRVAAVALGAHLATSCARLCFKL